MALFWPKLERHYRWQLVGRDDDDDDHGRGRCSSTNKGIHTSATVTEAQIPHDVHQRLYDRDPGTLLTQEKKALFAVNFLTGVQQNVNTAN